MTFSTGQLEATFSSRPMCGLLGHTNEAQVLVGEEKALALVDMGSMSTSIGDSFYKEHLEHKYPLQELKSLLEVDREGGHQLCRY